jgi:hypothetical protein
LAECVGDTLRVFQVVQVDRELFLPDASNSETVHFVLSTVVKPYPFRGHARSAVRTETAKALRKVLAVLVQLRRRHCGKH